MRFPRQRGSTSVMIRVFIPHSLSTVGAGCTGLTYASTNLAIAYSRELQNGFTQITGANLVAIATPGAWVSPGTGKLGRTQGRSPQPRIVAAISGHCSRQLNEGRRDGSFLDNSERQARKGARRQRY